MKFMLFILSMTLVGCSATPSAFNEVASHEYSNTMDIIEKAAQNAPKGVAGTYSFKIQASGTQGRFVYLNTELDYRDQRNITIALHPRVSNELNEKYADYSEDFFIGKSIVVEGLAKRIKINFTSEGRPTGKYYYQTHIRVKDSAQIAFIEGIH